MLDLHSRRDCRGRAMHGCKPNTAKWLCVSMVSMFLVWLIATGAWAQEQPAVPPQTPASQQSTPDEGAATQTPATDPSDKTGDNSSTKQDAPTPALRLGPGDLVEVGVYGVPELATKARVGNDGSLYLPLIDYVHVAGVSLEEAQKLIEKRLDDGGFVRNPHVTIFVDEYSSQGVSLLGEVGKPGIYPVLGDRRLLDLLSAAGGLTDRAGRKITITHRNQPQKTETVELSRNLTDSPEGNVNVRPGDTIEVHRAPIVYIVGDVGKPSGLLIDNGTLTVLQAIALAGGPNRTAKLNGTRILRKSNGPNGVVETQVPLKKMLQAKAPDMTLEPNDILFVPVSGAKQIAGRGVEAVLALTAVSIYAVHP
jgi:polysaccharide biosynthesis/export protein